MKRELLSRAFGDIDERFVAEAYREPGDAPGSSERNARMKTKRLITAVLAAVLLLALGAAAYAAFTGGWLSVFFAERQGKDLSPRQQEYLDTESVEISQSKTVDGYTLTVETAVCDRTELCLVVRVEGPEGAKLDYEPGEGYTWFNSIKMKSLGDERKGYGISSNIAGRRMQDGDGKDNTIRLVLMAHMEFPAGDSGFADGEIWRVSFADLYNYTGTVGGTRNILSEGEWSFDFPLTEQNEELEMIASPVACEALSGGEGKPKNTVGIEVTSFVLRPLGADCKFHLLPGETGISVEFYEAYLIMKNGDTLRLMTQSGGFSRDGSGGLYLQPDAPIPLEEVESLVLPGDVVVPRPVQP